MHYADMIKIKFKKAVRIDLIDQGLCSPKVRKRK